MANASFIPAIELSRHLAQRIEPQLRNLLPDVPISLALIGAGSDVLGFDTARSMDHDWGPRLTVVVDQHHAEKTSAAIVKNLDVLLPEEISGFPTRFARHPDGTLKADEKGALHRLEVKTVSSLVRDKLLIDDLTELDFPAWLSVPMQNLLELTSGDVFVDDTGDLTTLRERLRFYPDEVWRYQLAGMWMRIGQINPFVGRTGEVGDQAGSAAITASIARDLMRIALLQSRQYSPYSKWLGTACSRTEAGGAIVHQFEEAQAARTWEVREKRINQAGAVLIEQFNHLGLVEPVEPAATQFHSRPFHVLPAEEIALKLRESLAGTGLDRLPATIGGIDVITDSTDALGSREFRLAVRAMFSAANARN